MSAFRIVVKRSVCNGCYSCLTACSMANEGYSSCASARLRVDLEPFAGENRIRICQQCKEAACARACPVGAIAFDSDRLVWRLDERLCIGCRQCVEACPFSTMLFDPISDRVMKCEHCAGRPQLACVEACPSGALQVRLRERASTTA